MNGEQTFQHDVVLQAPRHLVARMPGRGNLRIIGQSTLFEHMALIGWITRTGADADWQLTDTARRFDWLTTRTVIVRRRHYRQVYVTPRGLAALQVSLHGIAGPPAEPAPHPTLFD